MAKKRNRKSKRRKRKNTGQTAHASLAGFAPLIESKGIFDKIHQQVEIPQKQLVYRPTDKLIFVVLGLFVGCEHIDEINHRLRPDKVLLSGFGYDSCADQSVIQDTLDGCVKENVVQFKGVLKSLYVEHNQSQALVREAIEQSLTVTIDMDLTGRPISENAQGAKKGYFSKKRGIYGRQLARVLMPDTQEIIAEELYPGNRLSCQVFVEMLRETEQALGLDTQQKRERVCLRLDGGFGTDKNINHALWKGYQLLAKMFSGNRAKVLAKSVQQWVDVDAQGARQAGWVTKVHRYGRKTRQLAIRKPNPKKKDGFSYVVLVITDMTADMLTLLRSYDARSGVPESTFCQDNQGLAQRKLRKHKFFAQQMLVLLSQLAHNLIRWLQRWMVEALQTRKQMEVHAQQMLMGESNQAESSARFQTEIQQAIDSIQQRGIKRWVRQIFDFSGTILIKHGVVKRMTLNGAYPLIHRFRLAFEALLSPVGVQVCVART